ncbi:MSC_0624 family F1-like ATPase-associated membrane protein [[Mycoplasma] collis]|uniref:MSC_0624 family F1-like ATPase-associated membrane protein n=1 Tax=[Mycoplasma] collis TaxID=2127 RepID=UPI00051B99AF|nr:hypothetical protein [[Mycoplasma] collis]
MSNIHFKQNNLFFKLINNKNFYYLFFKYLLIIFLFLGTFFIFSFSDKAIFINLEFKNVLFDFSIYKNQLINLIILLKTTVLLFIFYSSFIKNFLNLNNYKETIKKYKIWFLGYIFFTFTSFILIFVLYNPKDFEKSEITINSLNKTLYTNILLFLYILYNSIFKFYSWYLNLKINPLSAVKKWMVIISVASELILFLFYFILIFIFIKNNDLNSENIAKEIFVNNKIYVFISRLFYTNNFFNNFLIFVFSLLLTMISIFINIDKIYLTITKQLPKKYFKNITIVLTTIIFAFFFNFIINLIKTKNNNSIYEANDNFNFLNIFIYLFLALLLIFLFIFIKIYFKKIINTFLSKTILYIVFQITLWTITFIILILNNSEINRFNFIYLLSSFFSLILIFIYFWKDKFNSNIPIFITNIFLINILLIIAIENLNFIIINESNNFILETISEYFSFSEIMIISIILLWIIYLIAISIELLIIKIKIFKNKKNIKTESKKMV